MGKSINLLPSTLYITATPIGNASDISMRAIEVLRKVNVVACEDTRITAKLCTRHDIHADLISYHEHNAQRTRPTLIARLKRGETVALVSDAGTPLISDPGYKLVQCCIQNNIPITALPGASSILTALILSGQPTDRFFFGGFLPTKAAARQTVLRNFSTIPATLIFMESTKRLSKSLSDMMTVLGNRNVAVCREMTKVFEEVRRAPLETMVASYVTEDVPKGEIVLVIGPPLKEAPISNAEVDELLRDALQHSSLREAVRDIAELLDLPRKTLYQRALELNKHQEKD